MTEKTHELRLKINAAAAKRGAREFVGAIGTVKAAVRELDRDSTGAFTKLRKGKVQIDTKGAKSAALDLDKVAKGVSRFDAEAKKLGLSIASATRVANSQFDRLYEKAERLGDTQGIRTLDQALARLQVRLQAATSPLDVRLAKSQFQDVAASVMRTNRALEIQERKANIAAASMAKLNAAQTQTTTIFRASNGAMRQTALQVSQIGQMYSVSGDLMRSAFIQLPDLLLPFGTIPVLAGAAIGAMTPMILSFIGGADAADQFDDRLDSLKQTQNDLTSVTDLLKMTTSELVDKYGDAAIRVRELTVLQSQLRIAELTNQIREQSSVLSDAASAYTTNIDAGRNYRNVLNRIASDFGLSASAAREFETALQAAATADTLQGQISALRDVQELLSANGVSASQIPPELAAALDKMIDLSNESDAARKLADDLSDAVSDIAPSISPAVDEATALKAELASSLALLNKINRQDYLSEGYSGRGGDPRQFDNGAQYTRDLNYTDPQDIIDRFNKKASRKAGGGGGRSKRLSDEARAAKAATDAIQNRYQALQAEHRALQLVAEGQFKSIEAARLFAEAEAAGVNATDAKTRALLAQIDAVEVLKDRNEDSLQAGLQDSVKGSIESVLNGDFSFESFANGLRSKLSSVLSEKLTAKLFKDSSKTSQAARNAALMEAAFRSGGAQAAAQIKAAITGGATTTAATTARAGQTHAQAVGSAIQTSGQQHATAVRAATSGTPASAGSSAGGFLGFLGSLVGLPVAAEGMVTGQNGVPAVSTANFRLPAYAEGTPNTSGAHLAVLHDNEAVIPLSRGRKVGVELSGEHGGTVYAPVNNVTNHIHVEKQQNGESDQAFAQRLAEAVEDQLDQKIDRRIYEANRYGGINNPR